MRLALSSSVLPKPFVPMTMNLSSRSGLRKPSISGVRWSSDSSKSSATRMSSASTVHARIFLLRPSERGPYHIVVTAVILAGRVRRPGRDVLRAIGHEDVECAYSGADALRLLERRPSPRLDDCAVAPRASGPVKRLTDDQALRRHPRPDLPRRR